MGWLGVSHGVSRRAPMIDWPELAPTRERTASLTERGVSQAQETTLSVNERGS